MMVGPHVFIFRHAGQLLSKGKTRRRGNPFALRDQIETCPWNAETVQQQAEATIGTSIIATCRLNRRQSDFESLYPD